jgi:hypothetical protein
MPESLTTRIAALFLIGIGTSGASPRQEQALSRDYSLDDLAQFVDGEFRPMSLLIVGVKAV